MRAVSPKPIKRGTGHGRLQGTLNRPSSSGELPMTCAPRPVPLTPLLERASLLPGPASRVNP